MGCKCTEVGVSSKAMDRGSSFVVDDRMVEKLQEVDNGYMEGVFEQGVEMVVLVELVG